MEDGSNIYSQGKRVVSAALDSTMRRTRQTCLHNRPRLRPSSPDFRRISEGESGKERDCQREPVAAWRVVRQCRECARRSGEVIRGKHTILDSSNGSRAVRRTGRGARAPDEPSNTRRAASAECEADVMGETIRERDHYIARLEDRLRCARIQADHVAASMGRKDFCIAKLQDRAQELAREVTIVRGGGLRAAVGRWMPGGVYNMSINQGWPSGMANTALERGEFAVDEMLGAGNFGQVWAVQHRGQQFALKQVAPDSAYARSTALSEMLAIQRVGCHPNVVATLAMDDRPATRPILMERASGTLSQTLLGPNNLRASMGDCFRFLQESSMGLAHVHQHGIIHCDVKSENILLFANGEDITAKVADFGLAIGCGEYRPAGIGTVGYIPPESLVGLVWASASQDIFSVGVMVAQVAMTEATRAGSLFCHPLLLNPEEQARLEELFTIGGDARAFATFLSLRAMNRGGALYDELLAPANVRIEACAREYLCNFVKQALSVQPTNRPLISEVITTLTGLSATREHPPPAAATGAPPDPEELLDLPPQLDMM